MTAVTYRALDTLNEDKDATYSVYESPKGFELLCISKHTSDVLYRLKFDSEKQLENAVVMLSQAHESYELNPLSFGDTKEEYIRRSI